MNTENRLMLYGIICIALSFVVMHYLNKDYNLNGGKRILSSSRYGRIAYWSSLFLLIIFVNTIDKLIEIFVREQSCFDWLNGWIAWIVAVLIGFLFVGSIYLTTYAGYKTRIREGIKDDETDA